MIRSTTASIGAEEQGSVWALWAAQLSLPLGYFVKFLLRNLTIGTLQKSSFWFNSGPGFTAYGTDAPGLRNLGALTQAS